VVFRSENSLLIGAYRRARTDLAAIDPATFGGTARLSGSSLAGLAPGAAMARCERSARDPRGAATAGDLSLEKGSRAVVLALGTARETSAVFRSPACSRASPASRAPDLVVGRAAYRSATGAAPVDFSSRGRATRARRPCPAVARAALWARDA
jgi:hypothetical protein